MRNINAIAALSLSLTTLVSCGSSSQNINGFWMGQVKNPDNSLALTFTTNMTQGSGSSVNVSNFNFGGPVACFTSGFGEIATFHSAASSKGFQTGSFAMTVSTAFPFAVNNVLALQGTRNPDGSISGTWALTGQPGCSGAGNFTMNIPPPV